MKVITTGPLVLTAIACSHALDGGNSYTFSTCPDTGGSTEAGPPPGRGEFLTRYCDLLRSCSNASSCLFEISDADAFHPSMAAACLDEVQALPIAERCPGLPQPVSCEKAFGSDCIGPSTER
jgi:hypothetical protein